MNAFSHLNNLPIDIIAFGSLYNCVVRLNSYNNGRIAIQLYSDNAPFATASVNIPHVSLEENEVCMKFWSENEPLRQPLLDTRWFIDTEKRVPTGFVKAEVWKVSC